MRYFFISLIIGVCLVALLLILFFKAGKKNKKERNADRQLVLNCGDEGLIRLYEQAESENEREGIVEFIKEKLAREEKGLSGSALDIIPAGSLNTETPAPDEASQRRALVGVLAGLGGEKEADDAAEAMARPDFMQMRSLDEVDWQAVEESLQKKREEGERVMAQNLHIQEVLSKIKDIEESLTMEKQDHEH